MIAVLGGLIAAAAWGCSTIFAGRASRQIGPESTLGWVGIGGAVVITPVALIYGIRPGTEWTDWALVVVAALGSVVGLRFTYKALSQGKVGVVVAITSTEGAIAAAIAFALGAPFGLLAGLGIALATGGVAVSRKSSGKQIAKPRTTTRQNSVGIALPARRHSAVEVGSKAAAAAASCSARKPWSIIISIGRRKRSWGSA